MPSAIARVGAGFALPAPARLLRGMALAANRGTGVAAQMGVQVAVGALAGPAGIGLLQLHMAWSTLLGEMVAAGEPTRALRDHAVRGANAQTTKDIAKALRRAAQRMLSYSLLLTLFVLATLELGPAKLLGLESGPLLLSVLLAAPLFAITRLLAETLKALDRAFWAVLIENTLIPLAVLAICGLLALGVWPATTGVILAAAVGGLALSVLLMLRVLAKRLANPGATDVHDARGRPLPAGREQLHFWLNSLLNIAFLQLPFLLMPWLIPPEEIGRYAVAHKLLNVITTLLILMAAVYGPRFARAAAQRDAIRLTRLLAATQRISLALFLPAAALLLLLAEPLARLFSLEADSLLPLLALLAAGQLCNASTGLAGVLLNMSGAAHLEFRLLLASCLLTGALALAMAQIWSVLGVAAAVTAGITLRNAASYAAARQHILTLTVPGTDPS